MNKTIIGYALSQLNIENKGNLQFEILCCNLIPQSLDKAFLPSSNDLEYAFGDKISGDVVLLSDGEKSKNYFTQENES